MSDDAGAPRIRVTADGPYEVTGGVPLLRCEIVTNDDGESIGWEETAEIAVGDEYLLCRCGQSGDKPFCDFTHLATEFDGTETASRTVFNEEAACFDGPGFRLKDARQLCAEARFCDRGGGLWNLVAHTHEPDILALAREEAMLCPSGRYVACDPDSDEPDEPSFEPSIAIIEDPALGVSGPLWVRGGIPVIGADGVPYEVRNRMTLCRCGHSCNKPFCDGSHVAEKFVDEGAR